MKNTAFSGIIKGKPQEESFWPSKEYVLKIEGVGSGTIQVRYTAAWIIGRNESTLRLAPPIRPPSISDS